MEPLVSFVATSRNDDHGGDVLRRTQSFVDGVARQANRHKVATELVLVDWNPPGARAPLADVIDWPKGTEHFTARVVVVPLGVHARVRHSEKLAMFQMIAKNVGIRRARGRYIAATNIDIIFSDELFQGLTAEAMRPGVLYRSDRWDIPNEIQLEPDFDKLLQRARSSPMRKNLVDGTYVLKDGEFKNSTQDRIDWMILNQLDDAIGRAQEFINVRKNYEQGAALLEEIRTRMIPQSRRNYKIPPLHTNGCGDYTLMAREDWFRLRGYPEWNVFSWAIDSVFIYQAHYNGYAVVELPADQTHYHIEHDYGSGWTPDGASTLWTRLDQRCIPYLKYAETMEIFHDLRERGEDGDFVVYNGLDWGFAADDLPDETVAAPALPARKVRARNEGVLKEIFDPTQGWPSIECGVSRAYKPVPAAKHIVIPGGGATRLRFRTQDTAWTYAAGFDLRPELRRGGEWWLRFRIKVISGAVSAGILNSDQTKFLSQSIELTPGETRDEYLYVREGAQVSCLMFRNSSKDVASEAEIESITLFSLRLGDGAEPTAEALKQIERDAAAELAQPRLPPLPPPAPRSRVKFRSLDLGALPREAYDVECTGEAGRFVVASSSPEEALSLKIDLRNVGLSSEPLLRARVSVEMGAVDLVAVGADGLRVLAQSGVVSAGQPRDVMLDLNGARALGLRNRHGGPSRAVISAVEISEAEAFDFEAGIGGEAIYETHPDAVIKRAGLSTSVVTPAAKGAYGAGWDLRLAFLGGGPRRISAKVRTRSGRVCIGLIDAEHQTWISLSDPIPAGETRIVAFDTMPDQRAAALIVFNDAATASDVEIESVHIAAPWRYFVRVAPYLPYLKPTSKTAARLTLRRAWENPRLAPLRRAAPGSLRQAWRRLYGSVRS